MIRKRMRHINRYREIVKALTKFGFGYVVKEIGLFHLLSSPKRLTASYHMEQGRPLGKRLRLMLEELGPTFIKLGQIISIRRDLLPEQLTRELENLQDQVKPVSFDLAKNRIEEELGAPIHELFAEFDEQSLAAASIGQVHKATLKSGEIVAVKIRRPHIEHRVETDLEILMDITRLIEQRFSWAKQYQIRDMVDELSEAIKMEMDFSREARNTEKIAQQFEKDPQIVIPKVFWNYTTKGILTTQFIVGKKYSDLKQMPEEAFDKTLIAKRLVNSFLSQVLDAGVYHGDPHPGNLYFLPDNKIAYIDFGQIGTLTLEMKDNFSRLIIGLMQKNTDLLVKSVMRMALHPEEIQKEKLTDDVNLLSDKYSEIPMSQIKVGEAISDLFRTTQKHQIRIPKDYTLLGKAMMTLEGLITDLDSELNMLELAQPFGQKLILERANPKNILTRLWGDIYDIGQETRELPNLLRRVLLKVDKGNTHIEMELPQIEKLLLRLDRIGNRISFSITLLAFSIIIVGLIIAKTFGNHLLTYLPIDHIGVGILIFMFLMLLLSIFRSGRL